ncbi:hypothetical protein IKF30_02290 [Candidatus Saccharibacteria bacterium]|nr:hypothetical protein [Candidatus Saccharibacteria bacterium]
MGNTFKKRGQKFVRKFSRVTAKASEEGKEHIKENFFGRLQNVGNIKLLILEWSLLIVALVLLAVAQAFWFADSYSENVFSNGGSYIEATLGDVNSMNPLFATTDSEKVLSRLMFGTLVTIDYSGHPNVGLASSVTPSEDGKTWTVKLRDGLTWSDGEPITNDDVIYTVELIRNPRVDSVYDTNLANVKVSVNENGEIVFDLPSAYADFISALNIPILPKHILAESDPETLIENTFSTAPVTSGAFTFNAQQTTSRTDETVVYLSANPDYYKGGPLLNSFAIHTYDDKEAIISALNAGTVTATAELTEADRDSVNTGQFLEKNSSLSSGTFIFFNTKNSAVKDVAMRSAIRQGLDIAKLRELAPDTVALNYPILTSQIKLSKYPEIPGYDFDAAKAKIAELMGEEPIPLSIATVNSSFLPAVANELGEELKNLGFNVNVSVYEEDQEFMTNIISMRGYDILVYEVELGSDPDLLPYYHSSQASSKGLNLSNYRSALVDDLLLGARDTLDEELRVKKYETFLEYWVSDVPAIGLYQPNLTYYYNRNTQTFSNDTKLVTALDRFSDVTDWAVVKVTKNKTP